jgi:hypothetical protein
VSARDVSRGLNVEEWECSACGVKVRFDLEAMRGSGDPLTAPSQPAHWMSDMRGWHCLGCQREAVASAPTIEGDGTQAQQRRRALVEFELLREPAPTDLQIARGAKCTCAHVARLRADLVRCGKLPRRELHASDGSA